MPIYEIIDTVNQRCVNRIVWDGVTPWEPPADHVAQADTGLSINQSTALELNEDDVWVPVTP